jgi:hypothetical protein
MRLRWTMCHLLPLKVNEMGEVEGFKEDADTYFVSSQRRKLRSRPRLSWISSRRTILMPRSGLPVLILLLPPANS